VPGKKFVLFRLPAVFAEGKLRRGQPTRGRRSPTPERRTENGKRRKENGKNYEL
jgi:hypothetical protein